MSVIELTNGVTKIIKRPAAAGARPVRDSDEVGVHYVGRFADTKKVFDSSRDRGKVFGLRQGYGGVIQGWEIGLASMSVGEIATLHVPSEMGYGKKGAPPQIPGGADLEFEIEVVSACCSIEKVIIKESESNVSPKADNYVRITLVVKDEKDKVLDDHFASRPLEINLSQHTGKSDPDGRWKAGNVLKKVCETMVQGEVASFLIQDEVVDKFGNAPFWGKGRVKLEIAMLLVAKDEDLNGDGGVMKHMMVPGEGYEKPTDGAKVTFHYTVYPQGAAVASGVRESDPRASGEESGGREKGMASGGGVDYAKWSKFDLADDEGNIEGEPGGEPLSQSANKALEASKEAAEGRGAGAALFSSRASNPQGLTIFLGYGETFEGLEDALMTMKKGETAVFTISKQYSFSSHVSGQDEANSGAWPSDVPGGIYKYEVEMVLIAKGREHWNMSDDEKAAMAQLKRTRGNDFFKKGYYARALKLYDPIASTFFMKMPQRPSDAVNKSKASGGSGPQVLRPLNAPASADDEPPEEREFRASVQLPVLLNIAACKIKMGDFKDALKTCDKAIKLDPSCVKAHYRRGSAYTDMCKFDEARDAFNKVLELEPGNTDAKRELIKLKKAEEKSDRQQRKAFGNLFKQGGEGLGVEQPVAKSDNEIVTADLVRVPADTKKEMHPAVKDYMAGMADRIKAKAAENGMAEVKKSKTYSLEKDVAPSVRIAGMYGGDGDDGGDSD